jgi:hypothetical protein
LEVTRVDRLMVGRLVDTAWSNKIVLVIVLVLETSPDGFACF